MTDILTPDKMADLLRIQPEQVHELLDRGELPFFEVCGSAGFSRRM